MNDFREWLSDNLRYIMLGVGVILLIALGIAGAKLYGSMKNRVKEPPAKAQAETEEIQDVIVESEASQEAYTALVKDDPTILELISSYLEAKAARDFETVRKVYPSVNEEAEQAELDKGKVENFTNISTYSVEAPAKGDYLVYVCYDGRVEGIETPVPSLAQFYLSTDGKDGLIIADPAGNTEAQAFIAETRKSADVQNLISQVETECKEAVASDPLLKDFMSRYAGTDGASDVQEETETEEETEHTLMLYADQVNVRSEPDTTDVSNIIGTLVNGDSVTVIREVEDGWSEIEYAGGTGYVKSEFLVTEEEWNAANAAEYFAPAAADEDYTSDAYYEEDQYTY
mgnify:FL=1